jgi:hypothetical protein
MNRRKSALLSAVIFSMGAIANAVDVTVYNQDLGLVRETRKFDLKNGGNDISVVDVPSRIDATSVHFKSLTDPDAVSVIEQNFQYDLISQEKLLDKYIGKEIELERFSGPNGEKRETIKGTLLSSTSGRVLQMGKKIYLNPPGNAVLSELPEGFLTRPTLLWTVSSSKSGSHNCEISYLTAGMGWSADYVVVSNAKDDKMDLNAWVTINNASGATYKDAKLKLVAGDVNRVEPQAVPRMLMKANAFAGRAEESQFAEKTAADALMTDGPELKWGEVEDFADQIFQPKKSEAVKELLATPDDDGPELTLVDEASERAMKAQAETARKGQEFRRRMDEAKARRAEAAAAGKAEEEANRPVPKTEQQLFDEQVTDLEARLRQQKADYEQRFRMKLSLDRKRVERSLNETGFFASLRRGFGRLTNSETHQREQALKDYDETQRQLELLKASLSERQRDWASGNAFTETARNFFDNYQETPEQEPVDMEEVSRQEMEASFLKVDFQEALASARLGKFDQKQFHSLKERLRNTRQALTDLEQQHPSLKKMGTLKLGFEEVRASEEALKKIIALRNPEMGKDVPASDLELPDPLDPRSKPDEHLLRLRRKTTKAPTRKSA